MINDDAPDVQDDGVFDDVDFPEPPPAGEYRLSTKRDESKAGSTVAPHTAG